MILGFTGHRQLAYSSYVRQQIDKMLKEIKPDGLISGMAIGADTIAAEVCIELKIPLIVAIPFIGQEKRWPNAAKEQYNNLISKAAKVEIVSPGGFEIWKYQKRNEYIVDNSDMMIGVYLGVKGGTKNCLDYAEKVGKKIIIIDPRKTEIK